MGARGPVPKRDDQRRRRNAPAVPTNRAPGSASVEPPAPSPNWHPIAADWYRSLAESGQSHWYEPSDWHTARYVAEAMTRNLNAGGRFSGQLFAAVMSAMSELLTTEGARRRLRIELDKPAELGDDPSVTAIDDYRKRIGGG